MRKGLWCAAALAIVAAGLPMSGAAAGPKPSQTIVVATSDGLAKALVPENAGRRILLKKGTYSVSGTLTVPDGASLEGEGVMADAGGLPAGFTPGSVTRIVASAVFTGDVLRLGNGSSLRNLRVEDALDRQGNVVGVVSRAANDVLSASIVDCEVVNPNGFEQPLGDGPAGAALVVLTRNPEFAADPPPHTGAAVALQLAHSIVAGEFRSLFAMNFATGGRVSVTLSSNVVGGTLEAIAGIARPDAVRNATVAIDSSSNRYRPGSASPLGWQLGGGSSAPLQTPTLGASSNHVRIASTNDRIDGAFVGIYAFGGRRIGDLDVPSSDNTADLTLRGLAVSTVEGGADLWLAGAESGFRLRGFAGEFSPGDRNTLSVDAAGSSGSGERSNEYANVWGPSSPSTFGKGNRLVFAGTPAAFAATNVAILPPPPAALFGGG